MIGQGKRASDVELSGSMKLVSDSQTVIAHIVAMRAEEVVAPVEGAVPVAEAVVAAEPEVVVKKGKKEEEAGEKEKGKKK
jgi:large subunit ribosomal protein L25